MAKKEEEEAMAEASTKKEEKLGKALSFTSVSKRYADELRLLEGVSFDANYGELFVIVGPSGSGKSTILQMAAGLVLPQSGEIRVGGKQVFPEAQGDKGVRSALRKSLVSYVPQEDYLLESLNVQENVALALDLQEEDESRGKAKSRGDRVIEALQELGIDHLRDRKIHQISAGERRRCAIARGLVRNPAILIADEPTSSLDSERTVDFMKLVKEKLNGEASRMAVIIASHDVQELEPFADKIYEIRNFTLSRK